MARRSDIKPLPSRERLQELFSYDEKSGVLIWEIRDAHRNKWRAVITTKGYQRGVGRFSDLKEAKAAMSVARAKDHGEYARTI
jgi:ribosome biogenesis protein Nip4